MWKEIEEIKVGDICVSATGNKVKITRIETVADLEFIYYRKLGEYQVKDNMYGKEIFQSLFKVVEQDD